MVARASSDDAPGPATSGDTPAPLQAPQALIGLSGSRTFIPELESLRGIAVLLVFAFHVDRYVVFYPDSPTPSLFTAFARSGHTGVDLFFLLSGFLLALPLIAAGLGGTPVSVRQYARRRALRILPLYYAAVLIGTVMRSTQPSDLLHGLPYLAFLNGVAGMCSPLNPYSDAWWSLSTEVQFYLVLPLLPVLLRTPSRRAAGVTLVALYALAFAAMVMGWFWMPTVEGQMALVFSLFGRGPLFLWGIAAALLYHARGVVIRERLARSRWMRRGGADALLVALVLGLAVFLQWVVSIGPARQMSAPDQWWHVANGGWWTAFLLLVLLFPLSAKPLVCNAVLARLGVLSYSIYLVHAPLMQYGLKAARHLLRTWHLVGWNWESVTVIAVLAAACYGVSSLTYRFIERPFLTRKARLG